MEPKDPFPSTSEQVREFRSRIPVDILRQWEQPAGALPVLLIILRDWIIILSGYMLYIRMPNTLTLALSPWFMAWGQRALSTVNHDAIHRNISTRKFANDVITDLLLAPPLMSTARTQRHGHAAHHHYLGSEHDPEHGINNESSLKHYRNACFDHKTLVSLFLYDLLDPPFFVQHALGSLLSAPFQITAWWLALLVLIGSTLDPAPLHLPLPFPTPLGAPSSISISLSFLLLYQTARCLLSYTVFVFRELLDHSGLPATSITAFTRSSPCCNVVQWFLHPHSDNYHLLHHLCPRIPLTRLHGAHVWLVGNVEDYAKANHYEMYLRGDKPLFRVKMHEPVAQ